MVISCLGGGSNFGGFAIPFMHDVLKEGKKIKFIAAQSRVSPNLQGKYRYDLIFQVISISERATSKEKKSGHFSSLSDRDKEECISYINDLGYKLGKSELKTVPEDYTLADDEGWTGVEFISGDKEVEITIEEGLCNMPNLRIEYCAKVFLKIQEALPEWPWPYKPKKSLGLQI